MRNDFLGARAIPPSSVSYAQPTFIETPIDARQGNITSPFGTLHTADTTSSVINLADGDYVLNFSACGFASNWSSAYSRLFSYSLAGEYLGVVAMDYADNMDAGSVTAAKKTCFTITDASAKIFVWDTGATAQGGTISYSASLTRVIEKPEPGTASGWRMLTRGGIGLYLKECRKWMAAEI